MVTINNGSKAAQMIERISKEILRLTLTDEAALRLRVAAAKRNISPGELVSELVETRLPAVPLDEPEEVNVSSVLSKGAKSRARA